MNSPLSRIAALSLGLIGAATLVAYIGLGAALPKPTEPEARPLYWSVRLAPWNASAQTRLGMFYLAHNQPATAAEWFRRATVWDARSWHAWYYLGLARPTETSFRKVLALNPDYIAAKFQLANLVLNQHRYDDAVAAYTALLSTGADKTRVQQGLGMAVLGKHEYPEAERAFTEAISRYSGYGDAHAGLAAALQAEGDTARASHEARLAHNWRNIVPPRTDDPLSEDIEKSFPTALSLVQEAVNAHDPRAGIEAAEKAVALDPRMTLAWEHLIALYGEARRAKDALRAWDKLAALDPNNVRGRFNLAVSLTPSVADRSRVPALVAEIMKLDPTYFDAYRVLGVAAELDGNLDEAARQFHLAIEGDPSLSEARVDLGLIYLRTGRAKEAQTELLSALLPPCEHPERTIVRELTALRDQKFREAYAEAAKAQANQHQQYELIAVLSKAP